MIKEAYVSFEVAKLLKENGFDSRCHATYDTAVTGGKPRFSEYEVLSYFPNGMKNTDDKYNMVISAPTHQMAMRWLREVHDIDIIIFHEKLPNDCYWARIECHPFTEFQQEPEYKTYEEAVEAALKYCLEKIIT